MQDIDIAKYTVPNTEIVLEVSRSGTVYVQDRYIEQLSKNGNNYKRLQRGRYLTPTDNGTGYLQIKVTNKGKTIHIYLHRLVWVAFNGSIPEGLEIDHKDNDKSNCSLDNLQLLTRKQNMDKMFNSNPDVAKYFYSGC